MNEQFFALPEEKRLTIINAALEVFSQNEYKRAVTDEIAAKANISKGLLFYNFHNKKSLYFYLFQYVQETIKAQVVDEAYWQITDFFERLEYSVKCKTAILTRTPYLLDFSVRAFYSQKEDVSDDINQSMTAQIQDAFTTYFKSIDFSKFKDDIDPRNIFNMIVWTTDGFIHSKRSQGEHFTVDCMMKEYHNWVFMLKSISYKEEYLS